MMEPANTQKPANRTFAVIDGGMNFKPNVQTLPTTQKPKLLDQVRQAIRMRHYSYMTEKAYVGWIKRFIVFHGKRHPAEMGELEVQNFFQVLQWIQKSAHQRRTKRCMRFCFCTRKFYSGKSGLSKV